MKETNFLKKWNKSLVCFCLENDNMSISNLHLRHYEYKMCIALYIIRMLLCVLVFVFPVLCMLKLCVRSVAAVHLPTAFKIQSYCADEEKHVVVIVCLSLVIPLILCNYSILWALVLCFCREQSLQKMLLQSLVSL